MDITDIASEAIAESEAILAEFETKIVDDIKAAFNKAKKALGHNARG